MVKIQLRMSQGIRWSILYLVSWVLTAMILLILCHYPQSREENFPKVRSCSNCLLKG